MYIKALLISFIGLLLCIFLLPMTASANNRLNEESQATFVTTARINLRPTPSTDRAAITIVNARRTVEVLDFLDGEWFRVSYNNIEGYMYAGFLTSYYQPSTYDTSTGASTTETEEPDLSTDGSIINYSIVEDTTPDIIAPAHEADPEIELFDPAFYTNGEEDKEVQTTFITTARVNLRPTPSTDQNRITLIGSGRRVEVTDFRDGEWFQVTYNGLTGYLYARFLRELPQPGAHGTPGQVEKIEWSVARNIIPKNTPLTVIDVRTGLSYQITSFSHGRHADVVPATAEDTAIMRQAFGGSWCWTPRPILLLVDGRTLAASINGMPHGGTPNRTNNMNGHICMHFVGSRTHNGSTGHERDHQNAIREAYNTASRW